MSRTKIVKVVEVEQEAPKPKLSELQEDIQMLKQISVQKAELEKREKAIKAKINEAFEAEVADTRGNRFYTTSDGLILKREIRKKISFDEDKAKEFFDEKGLLDHVAVYTMSFDEEAIEQLIADGEIELEDLNDITKVDVSYATKFVKEVEYPEEEGV